MSDTTQKRFLVFAYQAYYPGGGWCDFKSAHDTIEEAHAGVKELAEKSRYDFVEIVDLERLEIVWQHG
jgi:hypothetical protein